MANTTRSPRKASPAIAARDREMVRLRNKERLSLAAIGELFPRNGKPMTKEGVRVALNRAKEAGVEVTVVRGKSRDHVNRHTERANARREEARRLFDSGMDEEAIIEEMHICGKTLRGYLEDLPAYAEARKAARRQPTKSALSYDEMGTLRRDDKLKIREISALAGVSTSRVSQVLQRQGFYEPKPETEERMGTVMCMLGAGESVKAVANAIGKGTSQVYALRSLSETISSRRAPQDDGE